MSGEPAKESVVKIERNIGIVALFIITLAISAGCAKKINTNPGVQYIQVSTSGTNLTNAVRHAKSGDVVVIDEGEYSEVKTKEQFPITVPNGVRIVAGKVWARSGVGGSSTNMSAWYQSGFNALARGAVVVDMDSSNQLNIFTMESDTTTENIRFRSLSGTVPQAIEANGVRNVAVLNCDMWTPSGIVMQGVKGITIKGCTFYPEGFTPNGPIAGASINSSENVVVRENTFSGYHKNLEIATSTGVQAIGNIIVRGWEGFRIDADSFQGAVIEDNDIWGNNRGGTTKDFLINAPATVTPLSMKGNVSFDPVFVDKEGDFRLAHSYSPLVLGRGGMPASVKVGALESVTYKTAITLNPNPAAPQGIAAKTPNTEVLRFSVTAAPTADVKLNGVCMIGLEILNNPSQPSRPIPQILVAETPLGQELAYHQASFTSDHGSKIWFSITKPTTVSANVERWYSVYFDTTGFQTGDTLQVNLTRFDWSDGTILRINDGQDGKVDGYQLTF